MAVYENVVIFPKGKNNSPPQSLEEILSKVRENKEHFAEEFAQDLIDYIANDVFNVGFDIPDENAVQVDASMQLVYEAIRSTILRLDNIHHPLQQIADDLYLDEEAIEN